MKGHRTTFLELFEDSHDGHPPITKIVIPIFQRDFAQGRLDDESTLIRERFVAALVNAVTSGTSMGLDFVYGDVKDGVFRPLDGQQRLTTLYLLHWYVASRAFILDKHAPWLRLSYATRPSAHDFTATLAEHPFQIETRPYLNRAQQPKEWITDQSWYQHPWDQDPTISAMLVMLDEIHACFEAAAPDFKLVWDRLEARSTDDTHGAIWFDFLRVDTELDEDLYIKMNSRGRPLTKFEVFKADLESAIKQANDERYQRLAKSMDVEWTDILWQYEKKSSGDQKIDDEFMRYLMFIIEICEWRDGAPERRWHHTVPPRLLQPEDRARLAFANPENPHAARNRNFLFHAFDTWVDTDPSVEFGKLFNAGGAGEGPLPLVSKSPDLFGACLTRYGSDFSVQETLLLFGVLLARQHRTALKPFDVARRLRSLRNLTATGLERTDRGMSNLVASTERLMLDEPEYALGRLEGLRREWAADEARKWNFMEEHPEVTHAVHELEDNRITRGCIMAFDLEKDTVAGRARAFTRVSAAEVRDLFGAALLTKGDYSRDMDWGGNRRQFGSSQSGESWTAIFTTGSFAELSSIRDPLAALLKDVNERSDSQTESPGVVLDAIRTKWLAEREARHHYDWRYYLVRYEGARSAEGDGRYHGTYNANTGGFSYGQLRLLHGKDYVSWFSDALLRAAWVDGGLHEVADEPSWRYNDLGLTLKASRIAIHCDDEAFRIELPTADESTSGSLSRALSPFRSDDSGLILVRQESRVDSEDRVQLCVRLVRALVDAGL
ncbi:MAG: hypothetical protein QG597_4865 [Actinomycetota bacterium]|nr:hypothetical protein [Actinomycetota bacterium]